MPLRTLALTACFVLAACAAARGAPSTPEAPDLDERAAGLFGGLAAGSTRFDEGESADGSAVDGVDEGWALELGYRFTPWFAISAGYVELGGLAPGGTSAIEEVDLAGLPLLFHGILPLGQRVALVGSLGGLRWSRRVERSDGGSARDDELGTSPAFGIGVRYDLNRARTLGLALGVTRYLEVGDDAAGGFDNDVTFATAGLTIGVP